MKLQKDSKERTQKSKLGVIIGRFQTPILHAGHLYLIGTAVQECDEVLIILGEPIEIDERNIYSSIERGILIRKVFNKVRITFIKDLESNKEWSDNIDKLIEIYLKAHNSNDVTLYHSRDSFKDSYSGIYPLKELPEISGFSATQIRNQLNK